MADTPTFVAGLRATGSSFFNADERPKNFREAILWLDPNGMTPITALSAKMKKETTDDPKIHWWEEVQDAKRGVIASGGATSSIVLATGPDETQGVRATNPALQFAAGDIVQFQPDAGGEPAVYSTGVELGKVTVVTSGTALTITRSYAGAAAITLVAGDHVLLVGKAYAEGASAADTTTSFPSQKENFCQIFKTAFELTNTARQTHFRSGDAWNNERKRAMFRHAEVLEQATLWGVANETAATTQPERTMGGLRHFLTSNVNAALGAIGENFFIDTVSPVFDFNAGGAGDERIVFAGNGAINKFNKAIRALAYTHFNNDGVLNLFGLKLLKTSIPQGVFLFKSHPLLNTDPIYTNSMFVLNPKGIINRPLRGRDTKIQKEIQANGADSRKDQWLTETSMELQYERTMGYFGGIT